jgi:hypothetical protein
MTITTINQSLIINHHQSPTPPSRYTSPSTNHQRQVEAFASSGVDRSKLVVMPEALDVHHYDPSDLVTKPLPLAGTCLDGLALDDPKRPFVFLSVFKMEDRKVWVVMVVGTD